MGYGFILVIFVTFSSLISKLPKAGIWLIIVKRCIGIFLILKDGRLVRKSYLFSPELIRQVFNAEK
ncbi:MAG: hypothetical protein KAS99_06435 [Candidatus Omnitrophica bacterium]|nr:hypothetical protein [Candidatus Omnitrophota bacterium]